MGQRFTPNGRSRLRRAERARELDLHRLSEEELEYHVLADTLDALRAQMPRLPADSGWRGTLLTWADALESDVKQLRGTLARR